MASSSPSAKINFIKLNQEELSTKIALLVSKNSKTKYWKIAPKYFEGKAAAFEIRQRKTYLTINECDTHLHLVGSRICLNFIINDVEYFLRAIVLEQIENDKQIIVELEEHCFRAEKRSKERLITYPIYEVYAYLKYQKEPSSNVVFFNKKDQKNRDFFSEIDNIQKNKIKALSDDLQVEDTEDLIGFRVEDISTSGLSFFASTKEKELILDKFSNNSFDLMLNFEMEVFNLEETQIVYKISYINSQFSGIPMYKIGITFKPSPNLKKKIEDISGITLDLIDYQKEFEEFIKNE